MAVEPPIIFRGISREDKRGAESFPDQIIGGTVDGHPGNLCTLGSS